ncbi:MAG: WYL domain-containing protein [Bacteroidetes bacterium]|nr:WYL domain-containing protein [Bacteroidota bacterium]
MPKNKEALIRYRVINRCLLDYSYVTKEQLIAACENALDIHPLGSRTIAGDINAMRYDRHLGYNAPIRYDRIKRAYYYEDPGYSIDALPINSDEMESLKFAAAILNQFKNVELFSKYSGNVQKVIDIVNIRRIEKDKEPLDFIDLEKVPFVKGSEYLEELITMIKAQQVVNIRYQSFYSDHSHTHVIHPYLLKEYRNRWYLVGLHDEFKDIRIYGFDRIMSIEKNMEKDYVASGFSPEEFFRHTIGVFATPPVPSKVLLSFNKPEAQYLITQPLHESQEIIEENDERVIIKLNVALTSELINFIWGWGSAVKVLEPEGLVKTIRDGLEKAFQQYKTE